MTVRDRNGITYTWVNPDRFGLHEGYWTCSGYGFEGVGGQQRGSIYKLGATEMRLLITYWAHTMGGLLKRLTKTDSTLQRTHGVNQHNKAGVEV